jgi:hypothetical protein
VRITTATSTPPSTFSRSDVAVSLEESPPFPRKRQPMAEDGEDVNKRFGRHQVAAVGLTHHPSTKQHRADKERHDRIGRKHRHMQHQMLCRTVEHRGPDELDRVR